MAKHIETWLCDICGEGYDSEKRASDCENSHKKIAQTNAGYEPGDQYPTHIDVEFVSGETRRYYTD